jgi:hypothetical protein
LCDGHIEELSPDRRQSLVGASLIIVGDIDELLDRDGPANVEGPVIGFFTIHLIHSADMTHSYLRVVRSHCLLVGAIRAYDFLAEIAVGED